jgi:hypothetical protein
MTSGGHSMAEAWNLQLQGRVRDLERDLAEAERHLCVLTTTERRGDREFVLARAFLAAMAVKRTRAAQIAKDVEVLVSGRERT